MKSRCLDESGPRPAAAGFTLVELLVVIAIIGILASLLLPGLAVAKERAHETTCINNFRQMGVGMRLYIDDHRGTFPSARGERKDPNSDAKIALYDLRFTMGGRTQKDSEHVLGVYARADERPLNPYVPAAETFRCPRDKGVAVQICASCPGMVSTKWEELGCSYNYNAGQLTRIAEKATRVPEQDGDVGLAGKAEDWVPEPTRYTLMYEPPARPWGCAGGAAIWVQWHRAQGQHEFKDPTVAPAKFISPILFVDGHVKVHNFSRALTADVYYPYEPTKDWIWYRPSDAAVAAK